MVKDNIFQSLSPWHRWPLAIADFRYRWFRARGQLIAIETRADLLAAAYASAPFFFRWFGLSLARAQFRIDSPTTDEAHRLNKELNLGAKVWPFSFNECSLAMRQGYLLVRDGQPQEVIITCVS